MDHDCRSAGPDIDRMPEDLSFLRERLTAADGLTLPASLTAEALFRRLDEGTLSMPEDNTNTPPEQTAPAEPVTEEPPGKEPGRVIPWEKALRRWLPAVACLAVVLLLYQGRQTAMARNFSLTTTADSAAPSSAAAYSITEAAAEDAPAEEAFAEEAQSPESAAPAPEPSPAAPAENGNARKAAGTENQFDAMKEETDSSADTAKSKGENYRNSGVGDPPTGGSKAESAPVPGYSDDQNPDAGYGEAEISPRVLAIRAEAEKLAAANAPDGCTYVLVINGCTREGEEDRVSFDVLYQTADSEEAGSLAFVCQIREEEKDGRGLWLEVLSCLPFD